MFSKIKFKIPTRFFFQIKVFVENMLIVLFILGEGATFSNSILK